MEKYPRLAVSYQLTEEYNIPSDIVEEALDRVSGKQSRVAITNGDLTIIIGHCMEHGFWAGLETEELTH